MQLVVRVWVKVLSAQLHCGAAPGAALSHLAAVWSWPALCVHSGRLYEAPNSLQSPWPASWRPDVHILTAGEIQIHNHYWHLFFLLFFPARQPAFSWVSVIFIIMNHCRYYYQVCFTSFNSCRWFTIERSPVLAAVSSTVNTHTHHRHVRPQHETAKTDSLS